MTITYDELVLEQFERTAHGHGDHTFFESARCVKYPRLVFIDRSDRRLRKTTREYYVDGKRILLHPEPLIMRPYIEEAARLLNITAVMTEEEKAIYFLCPLELTSPEIGNRAKLYEKTKPLLDKGFVEWKNGAYRRVPQQHQFDNTGFGACANCGLYVEECMEIPFCQMMKVERIKTNDNQTEETD